MTLALQPSDFNLKFTWRPVHALFALSRNFDPYLQLIFRQFLKVLGTIFKPYVQLYFSCGLATQRLDLYLFVRPSRLINLHLYYCKNRTILFMCHFAVELDEKCAFSAYYFWVYFTLCQLVFCVCEIIIGKLQYTYVIRYLKWGFRIKSF